jgi:hypothetical protein
VSTASLNAADLSPEQRKALGIKAPRGNGRLNKEKVRSWALRILAEMESLTQQERDRVLKHATRVNSI